MDERIGCVCERMGGSTCGGSDPTMGEGVVVMWKTRRRTRDDGDGEEEGAQWLGCRGL